MSRMIAGPRIGDPAPMTSFMRRRMNGIIDALGDGWDYGQATLRNNLHPNIPLRFDGRIIAWLAFPDGRVLHSVSGLCGRRSAYRLSCERIAAFMRAAADR